MANAFNHLDREGAVAVWNTLDSKTVPQRLAGRLHRICSIDNPSWFAICDAWL